MLSLIGPLGHNFDSVVHELRRFDGERLVYAPNPGNAGDSVISFACYRLFEKLRIPYQTYRDDGDYRGRVVVFSGGGNPTSPPSPVAARISKVHNECSALIVLPHTITHFPDLWSRLDSRATIFAREKSTLAFLQQHANGAKIISAHDMAFSLDLGELSRSKAVKTLLDCIRRGDDRWKAMARAIGKLAAARGELSAIRTDSEKTDVRPPRFNVDISRRLWPIDQERENAERISRLMFFYLSLPRHTITNRLHVGICSALLGKSVTMLDNSYGKNGNVYRFSMKNLPHVTFRGAEEGA